MQTFIDVVTLVESPSPRFPFYTVESPTGKYYVSALGGKEAHGLREGASLRLHKVELTQYTYYTLQRNVTNV